MSINTLLEVMSRLRDPDGGCPWDKQQTFESLVPYTLEEAYEVAETIEQGDYQELRDELGDLLFQVVFYAEIAREKQLFDFDDIANAISEKLVRRHPHVFASEQIDSVEEQNVAWEDHKRQERLKKSSVLSQQASELDGIAVSLPALVRAQKIQRRAAKTGFDWKEIESVYDKLSEETDEVREAVSQAVPDRIEDEVGDLLFAGVNLARFLGVDAEHALRRANRKFESRFRQVEKRVNKLGRDMSDMSVQELESIWESIKQLEHEQD